MATSGNGKGLLNRQTNAQTLAAAIHTAVPNLTIMDNDIAAALRNNFV